MIGLALIIVGSASVLVVVRAHYPTMAQTVTAKDIVEVGTSGPHPLKVLRTELRFVDATAGRVPTLEPDASSGILLDMDTNQILWQKDSHVPHAPASTTKVLTSLVALENFPLDKIIQITPDALKQEPDETKMGLRAGEKLTTKELLTGMLLVSGNDAATAFAIDTVGMDRFVTAMNAQTAALGLHDAHFVSPVGLDKPGQHVSAYDLAVIAMVAEENFPVFDSIVAQHSVDIPATDKHQAYPLYNVNRLLQLYPAAVGIKPGYTDDAGACLIAMATRNGHHLLSVLMNDPRLYTDSRGLLDWGFTQLGLPAQYPPTPAPTAVVKPSLQAKHG